MCFLLFLRCIVILNDTAGTLQDWDKTEVACGEKKQEKLSQDGVLESQVPGWWNMFAGSSSAQQQRERVQQASEYSWLWMSCRKHWASQTVLRMLLPTNIGYLPIYCVRMRMCACLYFKWKCILRVEESSGMVWNWYMHLCSQLQYIGSGLAVVCTRV